MIITKKSKYVEETHNVDLSGVLKGIPMFIGDIISHSKLGQFVGHAAGVKKTVPVKAADGQDKKQSVSV